MSGNECIGRTGGVERGAAAVQPTPAVRSASHEHPTPAPLPAEGKRSISCYRFYPHDRLCYSSAGCQEATGRHHERRRGHTGRK